MFYLWFLQFNIKTKNVWQSVLALCTHQRYNFILFDNWWLLRLYMKNILTLDTFNVFDSLQDSEVVLTPMGSQLVSILRSEALATWRATTQCRWEEELHSRESSGTPSQPRHLPTMECRPHTRPGNTRNSYTTSRTLMASTTEQTARNEDEFLCSFILTRQWSFKRHLLSSLSSLHFPLHPKFDWKPVFCVGRLLWYKRTVKEDMRDTAEIIITL